MIMIMFKNKIKIIITIIIINIIIIIIIIVFAAVVIITVLITCARLQQPELKTSATQSYQCVRCFSVTYCDARGNPYHFFEGGQGTAFTSFRFPTAK